METSPTDGSPQRSIATTPLDRYLRARSTTDRAVGRSFLRSMERMRDVFMREVALNWVMQVRIVWM